METKSELREIIESLAIAVLIVTFITVFVGRFCRVKGQSMEPTLHTGEWLWTDKIGYELGSPKLGDIVVLKYHDTRDKYVKRIIGLPNDTVEIKKGAVYVNNERLKETYIKEAVLNDFASTEVPANSYFVMGDNRNHSDDSRASVGFVPIEKIEGRAIVRLWPIWRFRIFWRPRIEKSYDYAAPGYAPGYAPGPPDDIGREGAITMPASEYTSVAKPPVGPVGEGQ
ncbi:MAG: signal peptidase I [Patescibacteria group bacterium]